LQITAYLDNYTELYTKRLLQELFPSTPPICESPWLEFIDMFQGDEDFAAIAEDLRAEREPELEEMT
jgi:hypothetical protein